jgi:hypothetical protein
MACTPSQRCGSARRIFRSSSRSIAGPQVDL